jgi:hypothetical protein
VDSALAQQLPHTKLLNAAAAAELRPLGLVRRGRSRTWIDDNGWWLGVVEFQPSSWSRGSYLNVGANWLWNVKTHLSFDVSAESDGYTSGRVRVPGHGEFVSYEDDDQFAPLAQQLAALAADQVRRLRARFVTISAAAESLRNASPGNLLGALNAGIALGLLGDAQAAEQMFQRFVDWYQTGDRVSHSDTNRSRVERAVDLQGLLPDPARFVARIRADIAAGRQALGLGCDFELPVQRVDQ